MSLDTAVTLTAKYALTSLGTGEIGLFFVDPNGVPTTRADAKLWHACIILARPRLALVPHIQARLLPFPTASQIRCHTPETPQVLPLYFPNTIASGIQGRTQLPSFPRPVEEQ